MVTRVIFGDVNLFWPYILRYLMDILRRDLLILETATDAQVVGTYLIRGYRDWETDRKSVV